MYKDIKDIVAVITGGANGIGLEIADKFLEKGAKNVILLDLDESQGNKAVDNLTNKYGDGKAEFLKCDVTTDLHKANEIIDKYKYVDVLVNSAGVRKSVRETIMINTTALIEWSLKFEEQWHKEKGGRGGTIINISSVYGFRPFNLVPVYSASKFAVVGFTRALGHEYNFEQSGVRVVAICPGFTETNMTKQFKMELENGVLGDCTAKLFKDIRWQKVEAVGNAAVEVFERARSGSCWLITRGQPVEEIIFNH